MNQGEFCTKCGKPLTPGIAFCTGCGAPVNRPSSAPTGGDVAMRHI